MSEATAAIVGPGGDYLPDRAVSDLDDPDLGAAALADDARGGGSGAGGAEEGGGMETWPDNDDEEDEPRPSWSSANTGAGPSTRRPPVAVSASGSRALPCLAVPRRSPRTGPRRPGRKKPRPRWTSIRGS